MSRNRPFPRPSRDRGRQRKSWRAFSIEALEGRALLAVVNPFVEGEPAGKSLNDTLATAQTVDFIKGDVVALEKSDWLSIQGSITKGTMNYNDGTTVIGDVDWYKFTFNTAKFGLFLDVDALDTGQALDLNGKMGVYDSDGNLVRESTGSSDMFTGKWGPDPAMYLDLQPGTYYVKMEGRWGTGNYTLRTLIDDTYTSTTVVPALSSNPGAPSTVYLDFKSYTGRDTGNPLTSDAWLTQPGGGNFQKMKANGTKSYTLDPINFSGNGHIGEADSFSPAERLFMKNVWVEVSEKFSPFDVNVSTVEPARFYSEKAVDAKGNFVGGQGPLPATRNVIANATSAINDDNKPVNGKGGGGGYAWVNVVKGGDPSYGITHNFTKEDVQDNDNVGIFTWNAFGTAQVVTHEQGHAFGLDHQFHLDANGKENVVPAIMNYAGNNYSQWSAGTNSDKKAQDDLAVVTQLANGFGYRADDHANDRTGASALVQAGNAFTGKGIVEKVDDLDFFRFNGGGKTTIAANTLPLDRVTMMDIVLKLYDSTGKLLETADPAKSRDAAITKDLTAGTYYISVEGTGKTPSGQPGNFLYALGQYWLNVQTAAPTNVAPTLSAGATSTFTQGQDPAVIAGAVTLADPDSPDWNGGRLTVTITQNGSVDDRLSVKADNVVTLKGNVISYNGAAIASTTGGAGASPLVIQFNKSGATLAAVQAVLARLTFANVAGKPTTTARSVQIVATDQQGAASAPSTATVNVVAVNAPPKVAVNSELLVNKGATLTIPNTSLKLTDPEQTAAQLVYTLTRVTGSGKLQLNGNDLAVNGTFTQDDVDQNLLQYVHDGSALLTDSFAFTASDGVGGTLAQTNFNIRIFNGLGPVLVNNTGITVSPGQNLTITPAMMSFTFPPGGAPADAWIGKLEYDLNGEGLTGPDIGDFVTRPDDKTYSNWYGNTIEKGNLYYRAPTAEQYAAWKKANPTATGTKIVYKVTNKYSGVDTGPLTFNITFNEVNAAPKIGASAPILNPAPEQIKHNTRNPYELDAREDNGGTRIGTLVAAAGISDPEENENLGVAVTNVDSLHGNWEYTTDGGATWTSFSDLSPQNTLLITGDPDRAIRFIPDLNYQGTAAITFRAWDGSSGAEGISDLTDPNFDQNSLSAGSLQAFQRVAPGFQPPSFDGGGDVEVEEGTSEVVVPNWATNLQYDATQGRSLYFLTELDTNVEPGVVMLDFDKEPEVSPDGTLSFTLAPGTYGHAHLFVYLTDGLTTSEGVLINIDVHPVNDAPTLTLGPDLKYRADSGPVTLAGWATNISAGAGEANQALSLRVTNSNPALFSQQPAIDPATGTLRFTPSRSATGVVTVTVTLTDDGKILEENEIVEESPGLVTKTFTITLDPGAPPTVNEKYLDQAARQLIGRGATDAELAAWSAALNTGGRTAAINLILATDDFRAARVTKIYQAIVGVAPDASATASYVQILKTGGTLTQVRAAIYGSAEYFSRRAGGTNSGFLTAMYRDAVGRGINASTRNRYLSTLNAGGSRASVAAAILATNDSINARAKALALEFLGVAPNRNTSRSYTNVFKAGDELGFISYLVSSNDYYNKVTNQTQSRNVTTPTTRAPRGPIRAFRSR